LYSSREVLLARQCIGNGDGLAGAGVAGGVRAAAKIAADDLTGVFVESRAQHEILDPGDIQHAGHGVHLARIGERHDDVAVSAHDLRAGRLDLGNGGGSVGPVFDTRLVEPRAIARERAADLVSRVEQAHPGDAVLTRKLVGFAGRHANFEGVVREVSDHVGTAGRQRIVRRLVNGSCELHHVVAALSRRISGNSQSRRNIKRFAAARRETAGLQADLRRIRLCRYLGGAERQAGGRYGGDGVKAA